VPRAIFHTPDDKKRGVSQLTRAGFLFGLVAIIHVIGWGLFFLFAPRYPAMAGLGALAYGLGLRHAFDADHISAIDDTTRYLLQKGRPPIAVGFFFSVGHSTVVILMTLALIVAAHTITALLPHARDYGAVIGASVSGVFLWLIGILNLIVLIEIIHIWRRMERGNYRQERLEALLARRGLTRRVLGSRLQNLINHSWQMYPVGMLFGLGFDTASEIALLAVAAGVAAKAVPTLAILSLPLIFAAGMSLMDTADGVFMVTAYSWAFTSPLRKIYYNITTTSLSVAIALIIGTIELLQVTATALRLHGWFFERLAALDFETLGYGIVALFIVGWGLSVAIWKIRRLDARDDPVPQLGRIRREG